MKISVQDGKNCEKLLKIEVPTDLITKEYDEYYKAIANQAKVPGFRPGKAPRNVLQLHYSEQAKDAVLKNLISDSYRTALKEKALQPLGYPEIKEVVFDEGKLSYQAKIETRPKIKLGKVTGLSVKKEKKTVKKEDIEAALTRVRESLAQFKGVEDRPAQLGDSLIVDYVCTVDGKEMEKRSEDWIEIREDEFLKGFSTQLIGAKIGEQKEISIQFPEKVGRKELSGKKGVFKVTIKEIKSKTIPELNDEMAKEAGEFKTLDELRAKIQQDLQGDIDREIEVGFEKALLAELIKQNKVDLPDGVVERRLQHLVEDAFQREHQHNHGGHHDHSEESHKQLRDKLTGELGAEARRQVHVAFLLDEIAEREKIEVKQEDLTARFEMIATQVRQPVETVQKYYSENEEALEGLNDQLRNEKAIEYLKKNAKSE